MNIISVSPLPFEMHVVMRDDDGTLWHDQVYFCGLVFDEKLNQNVEAFFDFDQEIGDFHPYHQYPGLVRYFIGPLPLDWKDQSKFLGNPR